jgi:hypothetical protein
MIKKQSPFNIFFIALSATGAVAASKRPFIVIIVISPSFTCLISILKSPNPDKPEKMPQRHKAKLFAKIYFFCVLVSCWQNVLRQNAQK